MYIQICDHLYKKVWGKKTSIYMARLWRSHRDSYKRYEMPILRETTENKISLTAWTLASLEIKKKKKIPHKSYRRENLFIDIKSTFSPSFENHIFHAALWLRVSLLFCYLKKNYFKIIFLCFRINIKNKK
jgi:hypothetical protein